jgi:ribonuclease T1
MLAALALQLIATSLYARDTRQSGIREIKLSELPKEARATLTLIKTGGPFPYPRDGIVFGNFERALPSQKRGYYHEYTVPTPGSRDRGARRIISGRIGEYYYTADHYKTFAWIRE